MERKDFIKKGLFGTSIFVASAAIGNVIKNEIDELQNLDAVQVPENILGFNHLPNNNSKIMENIILHKADTRGNADHGWLKSKHTFSFANYYNPDRMHFGVLRVLNDDSVEGGMGFGTHPHDNMEIISIPLEGDLQHKDSMNNVAVIKSGDIQVMSAGTGIYHSEYNKSEDKLVKFLQIWMFPNKKNVTPRYDQITLNLADRHNNLQQILSPSKDDSGVWVHQDAWFSIGKFDKDFLLKYQTKRKENVVYIFVLKGDLIINNTSVNTRDGIGLTNIENFNIKALTQDAEILVMDVPMTVA